MAADPNGLLKIGTCNVQREEESLRELRWSEEQVKRISLVGKCTSSLAGPGYHSSAERSLRPLAHTKSSPGLSAEGGGVPQRAGLE